MDSEQSPSNIDALALERERLALERQRLELEQQTRERELQLRSEELELRRTEQVYAQWRNPLFLGLIAAVIGLIGNMLVTVISGYNERQKTKREFDQTLTLESNKHRSALILEAIKTGDPDTAATNLAFFLEAYLLQDPDEKLATYLKERKPGTGGFLPSQTVPPERRAGAPGQKIPTKYPGVMAQITRFGTSGAFITLEIAVENETTKTTNHVCGMSQLAEISDQKTGESWTSVDAGGDVAGCHILPPSGKSGTWMRFPVPNPDKRVFSLKSQLFNTPVENLVLGRLQ
jgi:hypothetical protein